MDEVKNLEDLYFGGDKEVIAAINDKRTWIDRRFFIPANINEAIDENGLKHYPFIEAVFNNTLLFSSVEFANENFTSSECSSVENNANSLAVLTLFDEIDYNIDADFWILYDFTKMELSMYHELVANIYHKLPYESLRINKEKINEVGGDLIKSLIIGKNKESLLILSKDKLINMCYYCPVIERIYYKSTIRKDLLESLNEISTKLQVELEEIDEHWNTKHRTV